MTRGRVVLVPFPFDDLSATKVRPAVCLTNPVGPHRHIVLAFITSRATETLLPTDVALAEDETGFGLTGLRVSSTLCLHRLMTAAPSLILRELGELPPPKLTEVGRKLTQLFELAD
jgi:mRNA interferase MazF